MRGIRIGVGTSLQVPQVSVSSHSVWIGEHVSGTKVDLDLKSFSNDAGMKVLGIQHRRKGWEAAFIGATWRVEGIGLRTR